MAEAYKIIIQTQGEGSSAPKNPIAGDNNQSKPTSNEEEKNKDIYFKGQTLCLSFEIAYFYTKMVYNKHKIIYNIMVRK